MFPVIHSCGTTKLCLPDLSGLSDETVTCKDK